MDALLYYLARSLVALLQVLPLKAVARVGRAGGQLFYWLDLRHRRVALRNLALCFGSEKTEAERRSIARENFRRIGENFACAVKTAFMQTEQLKGVVEIVGIEKLPAGAPGQLPPSSVMALGHFGNFELFAKCGQIWPGCKGITTYRGLPHPSLNRLMQLLRERSGSLFFERRTEVKALKAALSRRGVVLGLLADQHAGHRGVWLPFLGHVCSTSPAPAVFALRYDYRLFTSICYRTSLARWRIEVGDEIPLHDQGNPRSVADITLDINRAFEAGVRRDPANWFWVHQRWKPMKKNRPVAEARQLASTMDAGS